MTFKKALKKEQNKEARALLDGFYSSLVRIGRLDSYYLIEWDNDSPATQILQYVGCDVALKYSNNTYKFVDEKICSNYNEQLYFEIEQAGRSGTGWAVAATKKTDLIVYFIHGLGLYILPAKQLKEWLLSNELMLKVHYSEESKGRKANKNLVATAEQIRTAFPNCFVPIAELEHTKK